MGSSFSNALKPATAAEIRAARIAATRAKKEGTEPAAVPAPTPTPAATPAPSRAPSPARAPTPAAAPTATPRRGLTHAGVPLPTAEEMAADLAALSAPSPARSRADSSSPRRPALSPEEARIEALLNDRDDIRGAINHALGELAAKGIEPISFKTSVTKEISETITTIETHEDGYEDIKLSDEQKAILGTHIWEARCQRAYAEAVDREEAEAFARRNFEAFDDEYEELRQMLERRAPSPSPEERMRALYENALATIPEEGKFNWRNAFAGASHNKMMTNFPDKQNYTNLFASAQLETETLKAHLAPTPENLAWFNNLRRALGLPEVKLTNLGHSLLPATPALLPQGLHGGVAPSSDDGVPQDILPDAPAAAEVDGVYKALERAVAANQVPRSWLGAYQENMELNRSVDNMSLRQAQRKEIDKLAKYVGKPISETGFIINEEFIEALEAAMAPRGPRTHFGGPALSDAHLFVGATPESWDLSNPSAAPRAAIAIAAPPAAAPAPMPAPAPHRERLHGDDAVPAPAKSDAELKAAYNAALATIPIEATRQHFNWFAHQKMRADFPTEQNAANLFKSAQKVIPELMPIFIQISKTDPAWINNLRRALELPALTLPHASSAGFADTSGSPRPAAAPAPMLAPALAPAAPNPFDDDSLFGATSAATGDDEDFWDSPVLAPDGPRAIAAPAAAPASAPRLPTPSYNPFDDAPAEEEGDKTPARAERVDEEEVAVALSPADLAAKAALERELRTQALRERYPQLEGIIAATRSDRELQDYFEVCNVSENADLKRLNDAVALLKSFSSEASGAAGKRDIMNDLLSNPLVMRSLLNPDEVSDEFATQFNKILRVPSGFTMSETYLREKRRQLVTLLNVYVKDAAVKPTIPLPAPGVPSGNFEAVTRALFDTIAAGAGRHPEACAIMQRTLSAVTPETVLEHRDAINLVSSFAGFALRDSSLPTEDVTFFQSIQSICKELKKYAPQPAARELKVLEAVKPPAARTDSDEEPTSGSGETKDRRTAGKKVAALTPSLVLPRQA